MGKTQVVTSHHARHPLHIMFVLKEYVPLITKRCNSSTILQFIITVIIKIVIMI